MTTNARRRSREAAEAQIDRHRKASGLAAISESLQPGWRLDRDYLEMLSITRHLLRQETPYPEGLDPYPKVGDAAWWGNCLWTVISRNNYIITLLRYGTRTPRRITRDIDIDRGRWRGLELL
jgi:hypothetical protein